MSPWPALESLAGVRDNKTQSVVKRYILNCIFWCSSEIISGARSHKILWYISWNLNYFAVLKKSVSGWPKSSSTTTSHFTGFFPPFSENKATTHNFHNFLDLECLRFKFKYFHFSDMITPKKLITHSFLSHRTLSSKMSSKLVYNSKTDKQTDLITLTPLPCHKWLTSQWWANLRSKLNVKSQILYAALSACISSSALLMDLNPYLKSQIDSSPNRNFFSA